MTSAIFSQRNKTGRLLGALGCAIALLAGCGTEPDDIASESSDLSFPVGPYVQNYQNTTVYDSTGRQLSSSTWVLCKSNEVLAGFHKGQAKGLCIPAALATCHTQPCLALSRIDTRIDYPGGDSRGTHTTILNGPYAMHGCPTNYFLQGITTSGSYEWLVCARFEGVGYQPGSPFVDFNGSSSTSLNLYGLTPNMHTCPATRNNAPYPAPVFDPAAAMVGIHTGANNLGCAY